MFPAPRRVSLAARPLPTGSTSDPITLSVHDAGEGPAVVLCHGFPELAYSWRHQFGPLVEAGFRVIAPDQRGYGGSDRPEAIEDYDLHHLTGDLCGLLDALGLERAVFVGHDWGGFVAWAMPVLHPDRVAGVVGVNTPYMQRTPIPPTQAMGAMVGGDASKHYVLWFQEPGVADPVLLENNRLLFEKMMRKGSDPAELVAEAMKSGEMDFNPFNRLAELEPRGEEMLSAAEIDVFVDAFARSGFTGGVNWYRNFDRNWETAPSFGTTKIEHPALMISAEWDLALPPALVEQMRPLVPGVEEHVIPRCGHWTQQEAPDELNRLLVDWLGRTQR